MPQLLVHGYPKACKYDMTESIFAKPKGLFELGDEVSLIFFGLV